MIKQNMVKWSGMLFILLILLVLTGCLDMRTVITVKKDGSGTVEQRFLMQKQFVEMLKGMAAMSGDSGEESGGSYLYKPEELKADAVSMGDGVTFSSAEPLETATMEGYRVVYAFSDINKVKVNQNPGDVIPAPSEDGESEAEYLTFSFKKGSTAALRINLPDEGEMEDDNDGEDYETGEPNPEDVEMAKQLYQDMRLSMIVKVEGNIVKTNATHYTGSEITIMDMDFGKIMSDDELVKKLAAADAGSLESTKSLVNTVPGIKVDLNRVVEVEFK